MIFIFRIFILILIPNENIIIISITTDLVVIHLKLIFKLQCSFFLF